MTKNQLEKIGKLAVIKKWFPDTLFRPPWQQKIMGSKLVAGATIALGLTVTAKIVEGILQYLKEQKLKAKSSTYYAKMLEAHPELKKEKPETVARY